MARNDWKALQAQFEYDNAKYGTKPKDWCVAKGLNYQTARRYIKVRKSAQNENAQKRSAQIKIKTAQNSEKVDKTKFTRKNSQKDKSNNFNSTNSDLKTPHLDQRDEKGRFRPGHSLSVGNAGNTGEPTNAFQPGNQVGRTSGIYSRLFPKDRQELFEFSELATLEDELALTRARLQSGIEFLNRVADDIIDATAMEEKIKLYEQYQKTEMRMDILTGRIESITKTLSSLGVDVVNKEKIIQDTNRIKNASRKLGLEADELQNKGKGDDTPISDIVSDIQSMSHTGLMSE